MDHALTAIAVLIEHGSLRDLDQALCDLCRLQHEREITLPLDPQMAALIAAWSRRLSKVHEHAEAHMCAAGGMKKHPSRPAPAPGAPTGGLDQIIRDMWSGQPRIQGPITQAEQADILKAIDQEDAFREFCTSGRVHKAGPGRTYPLLCWRGGKHDASAVVAAYREHRIERPWNPRPRDWEVALISDWLLLYISCRRDLIPWSRVQPRLVKTVAPFIRSRTPHKIRQEARIARKRFARAGLIRGGTGEYINMREAGFDVVRTLRREWDRLSGWQPWRPRSIHVEPEEAPPPMPQRPPDDE